MSHDAGEESSKQSANRLVDETSPYLLQHAHNPVDWYPWGNEAIETARDEDKPIFLSIGYSACHWCHVMERESFEDDEVAGVLNEHFVSIKVDREERPDLDSLYMDAVQMMTGQGGWPMTVFLDPETLKPFFAGTYFPKADKFGRPGFKSVLNHIREIWTNERQQVQSVGRKVMNRIEQAASPAQGDAPDRGPLASAYQRMDGTFDETYGGFGQAPKFPSAMKLRFLLHVWSDDEFDEADRDRALEMTETTLAWMTSGGMYDQIGGAFHRYSTDERWLVPHFEKMLYDNALLARTCTDVWRATGRASYARTVRETLDWAIREMTATDESSADDESRASGGYYSTQDADSEGEEGKFFVWTPDQVRDALDGDETEGDAEGACQWWDITKTGNFEGDSIPNRLHALESEGPEAAFEPRPEGIDELRAALFEARESRVAPDTDTKRLAAWNGLMIASMAEAGFALDESAYLNSANQAAEFIAREMVAGELLGADDSSSSESSESIRLMRSFKDGRARFPGYLDDHANMALAMATMFETTGERRWLRASELLCEEMIALFWDDDEGGFFYTAEHHDDVVVRQKEIIDNATPAGNSVATEVLVRLSLLTDRPEWHEMAGETLSVVGERLEQAPRAMGQMLQSLDMWLDDPLEVVILAPEEADNHEAMMRVVRETYVPNMVRVLVDASEGDELAAYADHVPLVEGREPRDGQTTAFVCQRGTCKRPTTNADELRELLAR